MSLTLLGRGLAENWRGLVVTAAMIGALLCFGLYAYQGIDLSIYDVLPEAVRALMGVPPHADAALMVYNEMLAAIGALVFAGVCIGIGAGCVADDEETGRASLILATATSRTKLALSKATALVLLVVVGGALLWGIAQAAPMLLGVEAGEARIGPLMAHLVANGLFHGALAFALATATGRRAVGSSVAVTVMVGGWIGSGLLPMWRADAADWLPWHWFNGTKPLVNGIDAGNLALQLGSSMLLLGFGVLVFAFRQMATASTRQRLSERLHVVSGPAKRRRPRVRVASPFALRMAAHGALVAYVAVALSVLMGLGMPLMYNGLVGALGSFELSFPQSMADLFGGGDIATPAGFLHLETFGMVAPFCVILVATAPASAGIAGEERAGRLAVLLAQPIGRVRLYGTVALVSALNSLIVATTLFLGMWGGLVLAEVEVSVAYLAAACLLLLLLGWFFGAFALAVSATTGRPGGTVWATTTVAVLGYFGYTLLLASGLEQWSFWSPFAAYLHGPVLADGMAWWQPVWLGAGTLALLIVGLPVWVRRDLRPARG